MLHIEVIREIRQLLDDEELSQRAIAEKVGVSRGVVGQMASGRRGLYGRSMPPRYARFHDLPTRPERCSGCGGFVYLPCQLCRARRFKALHHELALLVRGPRRVA